MPVPKEEFAEWFDWARAEFAEARPYPLIDEKVHSFDLLSAAYSQCSDNDATREHLESRLAQSQNEFATRFVILNYYYKLSRFNSEHKEENVAHLRRQFRRELAFFVGLRSVEDCTGANDISWEIVNACAVRDWTRAQALYLRLRSTEEIARGTFHAAYGHFLFRATFGDYDPEDPEDDSETLSQWSVTIVDRSSDSYLEDLGFEISMLGLGLKKAFSLPEGRSDEFLRDAKNELEKARDSLLSEFRPGLRSALARCYMARGEYQQAAKEYQALAEVFSDQLAWTGIGAKIDLLPAILDRIATALESAEDDHKLRGFLERWIQLQPGEIGPRKRLAKLEAKCGNYEAAWLRLSEAHSMDPARDEDWEATLLVALGARAGNEERAAEIFRKSLEKNPETQVTMDNLIGNYWPTLRFLTAQAKDSFRMATRLLFDSSFPEIAWPHATMAAGKSVELQLRAMIFEPFADAMRRTAPSIRTATPSTRPDPLTAFIERGGPLTMGQMVNSLLSVANPKPGVERSLRDWLKAHRPKLSGTLTYGRLSANIVEIRNRAAHAAISQEDALNAYRDSRTWLHAITDK